MSFLEQFERKPRPRSRERFFSPQAFLGFPQDFPQVIHNLNGFCEFPKSGSSRRIRTTTASLSAKETRYSHRKPGFVESAIENSCKFGPNSKIQTLLSGPFPKRPAAPFSLHKLSTSGCGLVETIPGFCSCQETGERFRRIFSSRSKSSCRLFRRNSSSSLGVWKAP
jgi:hypothetical protein